MAIASNKKKSYQKSLDPFWISEHFTVKNVSANPEFLISDVSVNEIAKAVSTPFFVYDLGIIRDQFESLQKAVSSNGIGIYYSMKANPSLAIVSGLIRIGAGLEIASLGELDVAITIGANPKKISFAGPVKSEEALRAAIEFGIGTINVESEDEFYRINAIAKEAGVIQKVGIRVNPKFGAESAGGHMGGGSQKFGIDDEKITEEFINKIKGLSNINLAGVHIFTATQMLNMQEFLQNIKNICKIAERLNNLFKVKYIDFGGGLGIPYEPLEQKLPLNEISKAIGKTLAQFPFISVNRIKLDIEPGRFLVGASGIYVARVDHMKNSRGVDYVMVDGGWHQMLRSAPKMNFGSHPIYNLSALGKEPTGIFDIAGPLCTSVDFLGVKISMQKPQKGDLIGVFDAGAYGFTESPNLFLSHPGPAEVLVSNKDFYIIRGSRNPKEYLKDQVVPPDSVYK